MRIGILGSGLITYIAIAEQLDGKVTWMEKITDEIPQVILWFFEIR